jgi:hypothetical protein
MGAPITTDKRAAAFQADGEIIYVLYEETFNDEADSDESEWFAFFIGPIDRKCRGKPLA